MTDGSGSVLHVRVRDVPGGLERLMGLLRRRAIPVRRLSVATAGDGHLEVIVRTEPSDRDPERLKHEVLALVDVVEARHLTGASADGTREMALARVRDGGALPEGSGRAISGEGGEAVVEITGSPSEVERALERLRESGSVGGVVRTGEVGVPGLGPAGDESIEDEKARGER